MPPDSSTSILHPDCSIHSSLSNLAWVNNLGWSLLVKGVVYSLAGLHAHASLIFQLAYKV